MHREIGPAVRIMLWLSVLLPSSSVRAQDLFETLHTFRGMSGVSLPANLLEGVDGNFYGTVYSGSAVARMTPQGTISIVHSLTSDEGGGVSRLLRGLDGNFYGTASANALGGTRIFRMTLDGTFTVLYTFAVGVAASSVTLAPDGNFYGTTGGGSGGRGTIFRLGADGALTTLHEFSGRTQPNGSGDRDGAFPRDFLRASDGNFYGTTTAGGDDGRGVFYRMTPAGVVTVLHSFPPPPYVGYDNVGLDLMEGANGNFYTSRGFEVSRFTAAGDVQVIGRIGPASLSKLVKASDGNLYGTMEASQVGPGRCFGAAVLKVSGDTVTTIHSFPGGCPPRPSDKPGLVPADGALYTNAGSGMVRVSFTGGATPIYSVTPTGEAVSVTPLFCSPDGVLYATAGTAETGSAALYSSQPSDRTGDRVTLNRLTHSYSGILADGAAPAAALVSADDGQLYGTTGRGGRFGLGTIFRITPDRTVTVLHSFAADADGAIPQALVQASDGSFYGTTLRGAGQAAGGTVFRMSREGTVTTLHRFGDALAGIVPSSPFFQAADGALYGTTVSGQIFRMSLDGVLTVVRTLDPSVEGPAPQITRGSDGNIYGRTECPARCTIFRMTPAGQVTILHVLPDYSGSGAVQLAADGNLYGPGYVDGFIVIFRVTADGVFSVRHRLDYTNDGSPLVTPFLPATDGNLYAVATGGGARNYGTVLQISPAGGTARLHSFAHTPDGAYPAGGVIEHPGGWIYGTTSGGAGGGGTIFRLRNAPREPVIATHPAAQGVKVGQAAVFTVAAIGSPAPTYQWEVSSNAGTTWTKVTDVAPYRGANTETLTVSAVSQDLYGNVYRAVAENTVGVAISRTASLTVPPKITVDRPALQFAARTDGNYARVWTDDQFVRLGQSGPGVVTWTATSDKPWILVSPASGIGPATLKVAVERFGVPVNLTNDTAKITLTVVGGDDPIPTVSVSLTILPPDASVPPFGRFDTPQTSGIALSGSVAVTGWALDNIVVNRVEIWRDLQPSEPTVPYAGPASDPRTGKVFVGTATFVEGARPDVEALYPTTPLNYRAGWGYLLLTWGLWNQGNGIYNLYAYAVDDEQNVATIGTKTIVVSNDTATRPFGAIDTPAIGATVNGVSFVNYGWTLTPRVNGAATCKVQPSGVRVSIDSGPLQPVVYGDNRPDVAAAFPGFSNSSTASGYYVFDATQLSHGTHTIGWLVTDDCNRSDGIGSRFFSVTAGTNALTTPALSLKAEALLSAGFRLKAETTGEESAAAVLLARGYGELPEIVEADSAGARTITVKQGERIELRLPRGFESVYQLGPSGQPRAVPIGSTWDAASQTFYWQPAPGFLGPYRIVFSNGAERISVRTVVVPRD
jgi:uncharacterized repeat protein (TIGR03803 family)